MYGRRKEVDWENMNSIFAFRIFKDHKPIFDPPLLSHLPRLISRFLGYRNGHHKEPPSWARYGSIFLATLAAMLANLAVEMHAPLFENHWHFSSLPPSFGASCILLYGSIDSPLAQPRNFFFGHLLASIIGTGIMKLFLINKSNEQYLWLSAALSVTCTSVAMEFTGAVHPPAGASAVLPSLDTSVRDLGWNFIPVIIIHACLFLGIAILLNNVCRQYPKWWLYPNTPGPEIKISTSEIKCPPNMSLSDEEIVVIQGIQKRMEDSMSQYV